MTTPEQQRDEQYGELTDAQLDLYDRMSEISEENYCAGWIIDNEYTIWNAITNGSQSTNGKKMEVPISPRLLKRCATLSIEIGGWIFWNDAPKFLPMAQWLLMVEVHAKKGGNLEH